MSGSVIVAGARTPMGRLLGSLKGFSGAQLGGVAIKAALERAGVAPDQVQYVIMGQVLTAGAGQIPARQAAVGRRHPDERAGLTVNKVCLSGLDAIALADQLIRAGEFDIVVAGGQESMTQAPHLLGKSREGFKYGDVQDARPHGHDGLFCAFDQVAMGASTEKYNGRYELTRAEQDEFSARSHQLAAAAAKKGVFAEEIAPVSIPQRKGDPIDVRHRRGRARRHDRREPGQAAPGVLLRRHDHRGLGLADLRRRGGRGRDEQGQGRGAGPELAGRDRRARCGGRAGRQPARAAGQRDRGGVRQGGHRAGRPGPRGDQRGVRRGRASCRRASSASTRRRSTSTAGPSRSATRSACPAPGSRCTWRWSSSAAAAASVRPRSAVAAGRATALIIRVPAAELTAAARPCAGPTYPTWSSGPGAVSSWPSPG